VAQQATGLIHQYGSQCTGLAADAHSARQAQR
jgi:hypothetical protein